jgi:predicted nucleic acid-binding protein
MEVVVDTSIVIAVVLNEETRSNLLEVTGEMGLLAPSSLHWEVGNALTSLFRRRRLTFEDGMKALGEYAGIPLRFEDVTLERALEVAHQHEIHAYDAYLIACAQDWELPLLTLDATQASVARRLGVEVMEVSS